jgi:hypothetical protein
MEYLDVYMREKLLNRGLFPVRVSEELIGLLVMRADPTVP